MKKLQTLLVVLLLSGCTTLEVGPQKDGSMVIQIDKETVQRCEIEGGCALVSDSMVMQLIKSICGI